MTFGNAITSSHRKSASRTWEGCRDRHVWKFNWTSALAEVGRQDTASAIAPLRAIVGDSEDGSKPRLLIHAFSGGGSSSLYHRYDLYQPAILPLHVTIFDSTPGVWTWSFASNLFSAGLRPGLIKSLVATPLGYLVAVLSWLFIKVLAVVPDGQRTWAAAHNDPTKNRGACRTYSYSDVDKMAAPGTIEAHANDAIAKGFDVVKREIFEGTAHVAHARADPDRYWCVVVETSKKSSGSLVGLIESQATRR
ncbi:Eukaryotic protein of unknown function (DUF829) domain containing protein [Naviculisporaceae sp. PSN 640]